MGSVTFYRECAPGALLSVLERLMDERMLLDFRLVGGTALALQLGHRVSVDIDLFSPAAFDAVPIVDLLCSEFGMVQVETAVNTVCGAIDGIKIDVMSHQYPMLEPPVELEGIRLAGLKDIAAMKLNAIANRGSKKDFWDVDAMLDHYTLEEMLEFFSQKYSHENVWYVEKSLSYFFDADAEPAPRDIRGRSWDEVKKNIARHIKL